MIRYMPIITIGKEIFKSRMQKEILKRIWFMDEKPGNCPYLKLKIKIIEQEKLFDNERKPKKQRWLSFRRK